MGSLTLVKRSLWIYIIPILCLLHPSQQSPTNTIEGTLQDLQNLILSKLDEMKFQLSAMDTRLTQVELEVTTIKDIANDIKLQGSAILEEVTPTKITEVSSKRLTLNSLEVDWIQPPGTPFITNFTVMWIKSSGGVKHVVTVPEPPYTITDLTDCIDYNITVTAYTKKGAGEPSDTLITGMDVTNGFEEYNHRVIRRTKKTDPELDWVSAMSFCDQFDAKPMIPRTTEDYQLYEEVHTSLGNARMWLPAHDRDEEGVLHWYTGELASEIPQSHWHKGQPMYNNYDQHDCLKYYICREFCGAGMISCDYEFRPTICEKTCNSTV